MDKKEIYNFSIQIKKLRTEANWTQKQVAGLLGVKYQSYQAYELGLTLPSLQNFIKLAEIYGISLDELIGRL